MLKPKDINDVHFSKAIRGYDADEVDRFLDTVTEDYSQLMRERAELAAENEALKARLADYERSVDEIKSAKEKIYRLAREVASKANAQAAQTEREAKERAERIILEAKRDSENQRRLYDRLQLETTRFKSKAIALFKSEIEQLNALPDLQVDPKEELKIRADELTEDEDILSSPYVEEYHPKRAAPQSIDFGEPAEDEEKERIKEELKANADPEEDFISRYTSEDVRTDGMFGVSAVPRGFTGEVVNKSEYHTGEVDERSESYDDAAKAEPHVAVGYAVVTPDEPTVLIDGPKTAAGEPENGAAADVSDEPAPIGIGVEEADETQTAAHETEEAEKAAVSTAGETVVFDIPDEAPAPHTFSVRRVTEKTDGEEKEEAAENSDNDGGDGNDENVSVSEIAQIIPDGDESKQEGRIEGGWFNATEEFETIDTDLEKQEKKPDDEQKTAKHPKFGDIRFGTDYDITEEEGSHFSFFKKKK